MILEKETFEKFGYYPSDLCLYARKPVLAKCEDCGTIRILKRKRYHHPLCPKCAQKGKRHHNFGKPSFYINNGDNHPRWKGGLVKRICLICSKSFKIKPSRIKGNQGKCCSLSCARKAKKIPTHHTKPERIFEEICVRNKLPFDFVGDGQLWIGKKGEKQLNPDFIEANGKKICVEIMGEYWHSLLLNPKIREEAVLTYREKHFRHFGWKSIFFWDTDLLREDAERFILIKLNKAFKNEEEASR